MTHEDQTSNFLYLLISYQMEDRLLHHIVHDFWVFTDFSLASGCSKTFNANSRSLNFFRYLWRLDNYCTLRILWIGWWAKVLCSLNLANRLTHQHATSSVLLAPPDLLQTSLTWSEMFSMNAAGWLCNQMRCSSSNWLHPWLAVCAYPPWKETFHNLESCPISLILMN